MKPIGKGHDGKPVYLRDIWPTQEEVNGTIAKCLSARMFHKQYDNVDNGNKEWNEIPVKGGELFNFDEKSTYIQEPPFFTDLTPRAGNRSARSQAHACWSWSATA